MSPDWATERDAALKSWGKRKPVLLNVFLRKEVLPLKIQKYAVIILNIERIELILMKPCFCLFFPISVVIKRI